MKKSKFKAVIYLISFTALLTVGIQVYRNVQNYQLNKQRLMNEVQLALDSGVESYYSDLVKETAFSVTFTDSGSFHSSAQFFPGNDTAWSAAGIQYQTGSNRDFNFTASNQIKNKIVLRGTNTKINVSKDSLNQLIKPTGIRAISVLNDSVINPKIDLALANRLLLSFTEEVDYAELYESVSAELARKNLDIDFAFSLIARNGDRIMHNNPDDSRFVMSTTAGSTYQFGPQNLEMRYTNTSLTILKRGLTDLAISLLISLTVIGALLYLYRIINQQKQLAEIKNDLISNITHEFKTPIATVATAIEAISHFNTQNDPGKTKKYLEISDGQLKKLNVMVEKLLETATLDTGALELNKTPVNLSLLVHTMIEKYRVVAQEKQINLLDESNDIVIEADAFHLENAISNLIDNAIKYGGQHITISLAKQQHSVQVIVQDDGGFIEKGDKERVFEKFYRVPKGNRHDVKGFGIGLYYTKKIIEKHDGTIELILGPGSTSFEVAI